MKRFLTAITAILIAVSTLAGCVSIEVSFRESPAPSPTPPKELTRGVIEGRVFTNESVELTFTAPEGWEYSTDEEIAEMVGNGAEIMGNSTANLSDEAFKKVNIFDMDATETETNTGVSVMYQKLTAAEAMYLSEEKYLDLLKEGLRAAAVFNCEFNDYPDTKIGLNTFKVLAVTYTDYGMTEYYFVRRTGDYMISVIALITGGSDIGSVMANFS